VTGVCRTTANVRINCNSQHFASCTLHVGTVAFILFQQAQCRYNGTIFLILNHTALLTSCKSEEWHILVMWTVWKTTDFQSYYYMATHMDIGQEEDQKKKWLDNIWQDCEDINMSILQPSRLSWDRNRTKCRNTVHKCGEGQTDRQTHMTNIHFVSYITHAKCIENWLKAITECYIQECTQGGIKDLYAQNCHAFYLKGTGQPVRQVPTWVNIIWAMPSPPVEYSYHCNSAVNYVDVLYLHNDIFLTDVIGYDQLTFS